MDRLVDSRYDGIAMRTVLLTTLLVQSGAAAESLGLERAVAMALERHERSAQAQAHVDAAAGRLAQARAFFFPTVSMSGTYTRRAFEVVRELDGVAVPLQQLNALAGAATLRWTLFDGRSIPLYRASLADQRAAKWEAAEARRRLAFEAGLGFLHTLAADQVLQAAVRRAELSRTSLADAQARQRAGLVGTNDVTRAELESATAARELIDAQGASRAAHLALGFLLVATEQEVAALEPPQALFQMAQAQAEAVNGTGVPRAAEQRGDVAALSARSEQLTSLASEPLWRLWPTVSLTAQARSTNETGFTGRPVDGFASVDLTWVLFDGGGRYGAHREREAQARAAALAARLGERQVALEVEQALVGLTASRAAVAQAEVATASATRNAAETAELYRQGLATALQLADAAARQFEAEVALVRARYSVAGSFLALRAALGVDPLGREAGP